MYNLYVFLRISPLSTQEEVEAAYLNFRDKVNSFAPGLSISETEFEKEFPEISRAFDTLRDPLLRADYDKSIVAAERVSLTPEPIAVEEVPLTFRERIGLATTYAAFLGLMLMVILFLYMLAGYSL
jgi:hypothetical protein